jgi:hypothetical protein
MCSRFIAAFSFMFLAIPVSLKHMRNMSINNYNSVVIQGRQIIYNEYHKYFY